LTLTCHARMNLETAWKGRQIEKLCGVLFQPSAFQQAMSEYPFPVSEQTALEDTLSSERPRVLVWI